MGYLSSYAEDMYAARMAVVDAHRLDTLDEALSTSRILAPFELEALKRTWNIDIHGSVGAGGVSSILLGTKDKEQVAVKLLAPDPRFTDIEVLQARFRKEYEIVSGLKGKAPVPKTFGIGDLFGRLFFVQQYLPYVSLAKWLRQTHTLEERVNLARSLGASYRRIHECGVVHRDIAPKNILVDDSCNTLLIDFGAACVLRSGGERTSDDITLPMHRFGSLKYSAPELRDDGLHGSVASDIFSFGVVLYELFLGRNIAGNLPPLSRFDRAIPSAISEFALRAISFQMDDRPGWEEWEDRAQSL